MRIINSILKKNRVILLAKLPEGRKQLKISKDQLLLAGFNFNYMTHQSALPSGLLAQFCYELGWVALEKNSCLIVHQLDVTRNDSLNSAWQVTLQTVYR